MANPVGFEGADFVFLAPEGMSANQCCDLPVFKTRGQIISCWRLSPEELTEIAQTGVVWLSVHGQQQPPVLVSGEALVTVDGKPSKAEPYTQPAPQRTG